MWQRETWDERKKRRTNYEEEKRPENGFISNDNWNRLPKLEGVKQQKLIPRNLGSQKYKVRVTVWKQRCLAKLRSLWRLWWRIHPLPLPTSYSKEPPVFLGLWLHHCSFQGQHLYIVFSLSEHHVLLCMSAYKISLCLPFTGIHAFEFTVHSDRIHLYFKLLILSRFVCFLLYPV